MNKNNCLKINSNFIWEDINKELVFIKQSNTFSSKKDVLYLLIQIRKYLEAICISDKYKYLKFYSDWIAHPKKDHIPSYMRNDILNIQNDKYSALKNLCLLDNLKIELNNFLKQYFNKQDPFFNNNVWLSFHSNLICLLDECPMILYNRYHIEISFSKESSYINLKSNIPNIVDTSFNTNR